MVLETEMTPSSTETQYVFYFTQNDFFLSLYEIVKVIINIHL